MTTKATTQKQKEQQVCIVGLGYVGLTLATVFAEEGATVTGVDSNAAIIDALSAGMPHFYEPGLEEKMALYSERLTFSTAITDAADATAYVIAVGSNLTNGVPDYSHVESASKNIGTVLKVGDVVVLRSTVTIGTTRTRVVPILEKISGLTAGKDFFVAFAPERTIEGKALEELRTLPQIISGLTRECRNITEQLFSQFSQHIVLCDTLEEAELAKLISNAYRDLSFSFANSVALIASEHNVNVNTVISVANDGYDRNRIPLPSPGVGGYCLTKDPQLLAYGGQKHPEAGNLFAQGRKVNQSMPAHVADIAGRFAGKFYKHSEPHIVVVGLAFKGSPATSDVRFSPSEAVIKSLKEKGFTKISGYDPHVPPDVFEGWQIGRIEDPEAIAASGDVVIFMHRNTYYENYETFAIGKGDKSSAKLVLDPWGMYNHVREAIIRGGITYANLGYKSFE